MLSIRKFALVAFMALIVLSLSTLFVNAGQIALSNNRGDTSTTWFITGEQTLVMNGFDLTPLSLQLPAVIDRVSIAVDSPVPGAAIDVVVYQDGNGGSPSDATLVGQTQANITQTGVVTITFPTPVTITQPVVWVGFYLPVNFKFLADNSGSSVLTYWGWTPGGRFDLARLSSATVLGPSNGTAPVNLDMKGIARITAEITGGISVTTSPGAPTVIVPTFAGTAAFSVTQVSSVDSAKLSVMKVYPPACDTLFWDTEDVGITFRSTIAPSCTAIWVGYAPANPLGYIRKQLYYDITFYNQNGNPLHDTLAAAVTHCIKVNPEDINTAVVGLAKGSPRVWEILPSLRIGELVCAEIPQSGGISYFVPGNATVTPTFTPSPTP
ncbi:MAG: hypothetical protein K8L97_26100 [Anaerolineae bacterium]|nr:hypothetical protein [Anaerolineae bacterium]